MGEVPQDFWERAQQILQHNLNRQNYETWIKPLRPLSFTENALVLEVPNKFFQEWLQEHYGKMLQEALVEATGVPVHIRFSISSSPPLLVEEKKNYHPWTDDQIAVQLNPRFTFDNFVVGANNRFAHAAALAVAESPTQSYNPLFIYGGVGLGKTHLLHAIGQYIREHTSQMKVVYVSTEKFMNEMINSIRDDRTLAFRNKYRRIDVLLIDDIQFLAGKESTQEEFFHTFNALYEARRQVVVTSDSHPRGIPTLEERLRSRFEWGLITDIQPPDLETRMAILRKKAECDKLDFPDEVILFLATKIKSNIRELEGSLIRLSAYASFTGSEITIDLAKEVLKDILKEDESKVVSVDLIQKVVAQYFNLKPSDMKAKRRTDAIAFPRQIAMYLTRELTELSLPEIGEYFGGRDHTTVMYACEKIRKKVEDDENFYRLIANLIGMIKA